MKFVQTEQLKSGMRLAKPIYNKNGVLLYERNSKLTTSAINSIQNFGLIGIYILEPAEPVPPFSKEDMEFEQAQTVYMFKLIDVYDKISKRESMGKLSELIDDVIERYGTLRHRINFNQNLRSPEDFMYKHAISTAIVAAMITHHIEISQQDFRVLIAAAFLYGFGYRFVSRNIQTKEETLSEEEQDIIQGALEKGIHYLRMTNDKPEYLPKTLALVEYFILSANPNRKPEHPAGNILLLSEILKVATTFDLQTGMMMGHKPQSEIMAMKYLTEHKDIYSEAIVSILAQCIHIIPAGSSVDLSNREKAIVLVENTINYMKPVILLLSDNQVYDLSNPAVSSQMQILDLMKTMDNRIEIDEDTLKQFNADEQLIELAEKFRKKKRTHDLT